jgi:minimal CRISPR polymerase domain
MSTLIVLGNPNQHTFANSIVAAENKSATLFNSPLKDIFVIHSTKSYEDLTKEKDWMKHLEVNGISIEKLTHRIIDLDPTNEAIEKFVDYVEFIVNGALSKNPDVIVDLTNSTSLYKNLLSIVAYVLDLEHQYVIDIAKVSNLIKEKPFLSPNDLQPCYVPLPSTTQLDNIAYLSLVELVRYKKIIQNQTEKYAQIDTVASDKKFFEDNLTHSVQLKLQGDRKKDNAIYRIVASSIAASAEDLITLLINKFSLTTNATSESRLTLGNKINLIESELAKKTLDGFDFGFFKKFNDFMLYLRNSSTHKSTTLADIERFKADLSVKMSFPFIEFYADIIYPILNNGNYTESPKKMKRLSGSEMRPEVTYYFGLDGDNTGLMLEELFMSAYDDNTFKQTSKTVFEAIEEIKSYIKGQVGSKIIFAAGDNILFKAAFEEPTLRKLQQIYYSKTSALTYSMGSGLTCSIGYGKSLREVYLALKLAKLEPGKNSIVGIEFV